MPQMTVRIKIPIVAVKNQALGRNLPFSRSTFSPVEVSYPDSPTLEGSCRDRAKMCGGADSSFRLKNADEFFNLRPRVIPAAYDRPQSFNERRQLSFEQPRLQIP